MPDVDAYMAFRQAAESAMARAHDAAADACGVDLRLGLEDTLTALADTIPLSPDEKTRERLKRAAQTIRRALADYDAGKLAELGALVEAAREDISTYDVPGD